MGELTAMTSELPFGLKSIATTYASFASTSLSAYVDLPSHNLRSTLDLIATPPVSSYPEDPTLGEDEWASVDFSALGNLETFMRFLEASNYCLGYSNSDDGGNDPSRECRTLKAAERDSSSNHDPWRSPWSMWSRASSGRGSST